jgi:g-D-glutamyl-meso-diaminopimelate peptidase
MNATRQTKLILVALLGALLLFVSIAVWYGTREGAYEDEVLEPDLMVEEEQAIVPKKQVIGTSVEGRPIELYTYGTGTSTLLFVGGIHGGYEWNSVLLAYEFIDHLDAGLLQVPDTLTVQVIPVLNPDGLYSVVRSGGRFIAADIPSNDAHTTGQGRMNANNVDLNRNFDCKWQPTGTWRGQTVSAGSAPFSEPEAKVLRDLVLVERPASVVFWHSRANAVYASECENGILPGTIELMRAYANAAKYAPIASFDAYPVSGDAEGWLASIGIPAVTVELDTRTDSEWARNKAGIEAMFTLYK